MKRDFFAKLFAELPLPVVVCSGAPGFHIRYVNVAAALLFSPSHSVQQLKSQVSLGSLGNILACGSAEGYDSFLNTLVTTGRVESYACEVITFDGSQLPVQIYANSAAFEEEPFFVLYLVSGGGSGAMMYDSRLATIINNTVLEENVDDAIDATLALSGASVQVSRVYIFEDVSPTTTSNTYEWCAPGIPPAISGLQNLDKADYSYDVIVESGLFIVNDIQMLPAEDREILEVQGIKALAIIPIYDYGRALGYIGFDDCNTPRDWTGDEIHFLKSVAVFIASLLRRRNSERNLLNSKNILQIITDNTDDVVYANRLDDYSLVFVSRSLCTLLGKTEAELLGRKCWEVLQAEGTVAPCDDCPVHQLKYDPELGKSNTCVWEGVSARTGRAFMARDSIVRWVDGQLVHLQIAVDITARKRYEQDLLQVASIDGMTGIFNREAGAQRLEAEMAEATAKYSLCFIDLDGLKKTNDTYGHTVGDALIVNTVQLLKEQLSEEDFICRWGGDEFLVWMAGDEANAQKVMDAATRAVERFNRDNPGKLQLGFSYGIAGYTPGAGDSLDSLVTLADKRMYTHKMAKRGIVMKRRRDDH